MATNKNFEVKNGLSVGGTERISSAGAFSGSLASGVTATTQSALDNSTKIATTSYTDAAITAVIGGAPGTLDTLNELAAAINDDASYASTLTTALATKLPLAGGTMTGALIVGSGGTTTYNAALRVAGDITTTVDGNAYQLYYTESRDFITNSGATAIIKQIDNDATTAKIDFKSWTNSTLMTIMNSGNVGIGVTPESTIKLDVSSGATHHVARFRFSDDNNGASNNILAHEYHAGVEIENVYSGAVPSANGTKIAKLSLSTVTAGGYGAHASIHTEATSNGYNAGELVFSTGSNASGNLTEHMRIGRTGNVGIGTDTPDSPLEISGADDTRLKLTDTGDSSELMLRSDGVNTQIYTNTAHDLGIYTSGNVGQLHLKQSTGNVGIGTTSPSYNLDVRDGIVFAGRAVSDDGSISYTNTAAVFSSRGVDHDAARSNVLRLMRDGTSSVQYAGLADFDLESWETNGVASRTAMTLKLGHGNLPQDVTDVMTWRSNGNVGVGTNTPQAKLSVNTPLTASSADMRALDIVVPGSWSLSGNAGHTSDITWTNNTSSGSIMGKFGLRYSGTTTNGSSEWVFKDMYQGGYAASGDIMFIGSNGIVLTPKQPAFRVDQTLVSGLSTGVYTAAFSEPSGTSFDIGNNFSGSIFTAPVAGTYQFSTSCRVDGMSGYFRIFISKNSSTDTNTNLHSIYGTPAGTYENLQVSGHLYLAQGDTARVLIESHSDTNWQSQGEGHFSGHLIG